MKDTQEGAPSLVPVVLPRDMSEREAAEFAEGLEILERLTRHAHKTAQRLERAKAGA